MSTNTISKDIQIELTRLRNQIVDSGLLLATIFAFITYTLSLLQLKETGFQLSYLTDLLVVGAMVLLTYNKKSLSLRLKSFIILGMLFLVFFIDLLQYGLLSANKVVLVLIPFFSLVVFSYRQVFIILGITVLGFILIGLLVVTDNNPMLIGGDPNLDRINSWAINLFLLLIVSGLIILASIKYNNTYATLLKNLKARNILIAQNEQSYREIFNSSADAIFIIDLKGDILEVNDPMLKTYGYSKEKVKNLTFQDLSSGTGTYSFENFQNNIQDAVQKGKIFFDWHARKKDGKLFWVEISLKHTYILGKERILAVVTDIDEKKNIELELEKYKNHLESLVKERTAALEKSNHELFNTNEALSEEREKLQSTLQKLKNTQTQLVNAEKMASLGVLSAGIAHEINNPLNFIKGGITGLENHFDSVPAENREELLELFDYINQGITRVANIVTSLNHFSRQGETSHETFNVHDIFDNCLVILQNQVKNRIEVIREYAPDIPNFKGNEGKLHQAFLNLLNNAVQSIEEQGKIYIKTMLDDAWISIKITDTGIGMHEDIIHRITEPFFTTKEPGEGTGLGLSITYNIVHEHKGKMEFSSSPGKGTTVSLALPV